MTQACGGKVERLAIAVDHRGVGTGVAVAALRPRRQTDTARQREPGRDRATRLSWRGFAQAGVLPAGRRPQAPATAWWTRQVAPGCRQPGYGRRSRAGSARRTAA